MRGAVHHWYWNPRGWEITRRVVSAVFGEFIIWAVGPYRSVRWRAT